MSKKRLLSGILLYTLGLSVLALGVAVSVQARLGVSPINSLPYVLSLLTPLNMGQWVTTVFILFILVQLMLKGRDFRLIDLTQLAFSTLFGFLVNIAKAICAPLVPHSYVMQLLMLMVSIVLIAVGITLYLGAGLVPMPAEGMTAALSDKLKHPFSKTKTAVDCSVVILSTTLSLIFLGRLEGVREGTILSALLIGTLVGPLRKRLNPFIGKWVKD